mmetsp:Transcript_27003/g.62347  ORF Transcript_27003/g.62347 Transcript_27003/m.62347 type:complete len:569 (+) Transcript_27003:95-1801(+)
MFQKVWADVERGWQDLYNQTFKTGTGGSVEEEEEDEAREESGLAAVARRTSRRLTTDISRTSRLLFSEVAASEASSQVTPRTPGGLSDQYPSSRPTRGGVSHAQGPWGAPSESDTSALDDPMIERRLRATSDFKASMSVYEDFGGKETAIFPELDATSTATGPATPKARDKHTGQAHLPPAASQNDLDRGRLRLAPALQDPMAIIHGNDMVVRQVMQDIDHRTLAAQRSEEAANTHPEIDTIVELQKLQSYTERHHREDDTNDSSDSELSSSDEKDKQRALEDNEKYMQDALNAYAKRLGQSKHPATVSAEGKLADWYKSSGRKDPLTFSRQYRAQAPRATQFDSSMTPGMSNTPTAIHRDIMLLPMDDSKDVAQFLSMGGPAVGGAQPVQPGGDASRNVGDSGSLARKEFSALAFQEVVAKSAAMAEDVNDYEQIDKAYRMVKEDADLFRHIQDSMKDEGHRLAVNETLAKNKQARLAANHKAIDDEAILFGEEGGTVTKRDSSEVDREASAFEGTEQLGHLVASSVRALSSDLEPSLFHGASQHLSQRGTGMQVASSRRPHGGRQR